MGDQLKNKPIVSALVHLSLSLSFSIEGDYLELSQFPYNPHPFPYNSHQSPLGTTGFLTSGIKVVDLETSEYDRQEILKMVNEVL